MREALARVKKDLGPRAVILHTRTPKRGGVLGFGAREVVEISATSDERVATLRRDERKQSERPGVEPKAPPKSALRREQPSTANSTGCSPNA